MSLSRVFRCSGCPAEGSHEGPGPLPKWCEDCRRKNLRAQQRAYYQQNKDHLIAQSLAYYEENKEEINASRRKKASCAKCNETLLHRNGDPLCGFCREEEAITTKGNEN